MKLSAYFRSHIVSLCLVVLFLAGWCVFAALAGVNGMVILLTALAVSLCAAAVLVCGYISAERRLKKLQRVADELERPYLLGEVLQRPVNAVELEYFNVMKTVSRSAIDAAESAARQRDEYRAYVEKWVHEIKTPLTACQLILAGGGDESKLRAQLRRADNTAESILWYARLQSAGASTQIAEVSVRAAADEAVKSEMELLIAAGVSVNTEGDFTACTDGKALVFMIKQLLVNSAKYCRGGKVWICAGQGVLTFEDNGSGILPHELPKIFNRGYVGSNGSGGTGMGLYLVKQTCAALGISLTAQSEKGRFTRFTFVFPK
ncbi:MAG TPA: HAMP domain-containing histidine kinase [Candidatus Coproplasma avistercoris]|nr:HAMP domain-containing histidine kinase [Candidatus Coproplasma avistercoris]